LQEQIVIIYDLLIQVSNVYKKIMNSLEDVERLIISSQYNLNWDIKEKAKLDNDLKIVLKKMKNFKQLTIDISEYLIMIADMFQSIDKQKSNILEKGINAINTSLIDRPIPKKINGLK